MNNLGPASSTTVKQLLGAMPPLGTLSPILEDNQFVMVTIPNASGKGATGCGSTTHSTKCDDGLGTGIAEAACGQEEIGAGAPPMVSVVEAEAVVVVAQSEAAASQGGDAAAPAQDGPGQPAAGEANSANQGEGTVPEPVGLYPKVP